MTNDEMFRREAALQKAFATSYKNFVIATGRNLRGIFIRFNKKFPGNFWNPEGENFPGFFWPKN